jgi:metal-responsive CopG/Arc/MetJ family transcriptional regulator
LKNIKVLYMLMYMASRTQIYLPDEQRVRIDEVCASEGTSLAQVVRDALEAYLSSRPNVKTALKSTFGAAPKLVVPSRDKWGERG